MGHLHAVLVVRGGKKLSLARSLASTVAPVLQTQIATRPQHVSAAPAASMLHRPRHHAQTVRLALLTWTPVLLLRALTAALIATLLPQQQLLARHVLTTPARTEL